MDTLRIGKVTNVYGSTGRLKVEYEDAGNSSCEIAMLSMNNEVSMPKVGDRVVTLHMSNGSSKGFVLGTYYGGGLQPKASSGYRKDFSNGAYATSKNGSYNLKATKVGISGSGASLSLSANASVVGSEVVIGSAAASEDESKEIEPDVYLKITSDTAEIKSTSTINVESEDTASLKAVTLDIEAETLSIKGTDIEIDASNLTLTCSYGSETFENILKRIERIEDQLGLPHTI